MVIYKGILVLKCQYFLEKIYIMCYNDRVENIRRIKMGNEITVKLKCRIKEISKILENKNFKIIEKFYLHDRYFIPKTLNLNNLTSREILSKAILLRNFDEEIPNKKQYKLTFKRKQIDKNGTILKQDKVECEILNIEDGENFVKAIGYTEIMNIKENDIVYEKNGLRIAIIDIQNGDKLIEIGRASCRERVCAYV